MLPTLLMMLALIPESGLASETVDSHEEQALATSGNVNMANINPLPATMATEPTKTLTQNHQIESMGYEMDSESDKQVNAPEVKCLEQSKKGTFDFQKAGVAKHFITCNRGTWG